VGDKIRVVVVDDSALMRQMLSRMMASDPAIEVVGAAPDPVIAREMIKTSNPDVVTLDIEMPNMDGLSFLEKIMRLRPMPVVMISSLTQQGADATLQALEMGAVDWVAKPKVDLQSGLAEKQAEIVEKIKAASKARVRGRSRNDARPAVAGSASKAGYATTEQIVAIGASTGGVEALREVVCALPPDSPGVLVTQHMPAGFTTRFAERLNGLAQVTVQEASDGQRVLPGHVYIAPGNYHLELVRTGANYICRVGDGPPVSGHRPSIDVLFRSVAKNAGGNAIGAILTGMGKDGAAGLKEMRSSGASTIGQNEATCVVYGMPKAAAAIGATETELPIERIAAAIIDRCRDRHVRI
jgi:two-component system, chemotaxis family, protein-glutamate methylesterase/glutaminase